MKNEINDWFISPNGDNKEYISNFFSKILEQLIATASNAAKSEPVPKAIEDFSFVDELDYPHDIDQIMQKLSVVYKNSMNASTSGYIGQMDSIPNIGAILGDLVTASINNNMLANEMSPFLTQLEERMIQVFYTWFGFDEQSGGVMTSGGTLANIQALTVARNKKLNIKNGNLFALQKQPVIFASEHAHSSITKAGMLLGIGIDNVIKIKSIDGGILSTSDLKHKIKQSLDNNKLPFAVVSTYGTTNSGSIDPVDEIQLICQEFDLWHHIDAIYGGAMILSKNQKHLYPSFEKADSLCFNPQKWMFVSKTCSLLIFRDYKEFKNNFQIEAPYVSNANHRTNLGELGIQGSRHASVLKLWLSLYLIGKDSYGDIIDLNMSIAQSFATFVLEHKHLELYTQPELNIILFRPIKTTRQSKEEHEKITADFQDYLHKENMYFSLIPWEGETWLKCVFLNPYFNTKELERLQSLIRRYFG